MMSDRCPCCGAPAVFVSGDEGTNAVLFDASAITLYVESLEDAIERAHVEDPLALALRQEYDRAIGA